MAFLHLGTLDSTSTLPLGAILNNEIIKKHKNVENEALNILQKGHVYIMRAELPISSTPPAPGNHHFYSVSMSLSFFFF